MNKYISFFLKTQLFAVLTVLLLLLVAVPLFLMSMTKSLLPILLWVPMVGVIFTLVRFADDEEST